MELLILLLVIALLFLPGLQALQTAMGSPPGPARSNAVVIFLFCLIMGLIVLYLDGYLNVHLGGHG